MIKIPKNLLALATQSFRDERKEGREDE